MFDTNFGIRIIKMESGDNYIGHVYYDEINQFIKIKYPLFLKSTKTKQSDTSETYAIGFFAVSPFSNEKEMVVNFMKWVDMIEPSEKVLSQYKSIVDGMIGIKEDFKNIDMEDICNKFEDDIKKAPKKKETPKKAKKLQPPTKSNPPETKKRDIRDRWVDRL